MRDETRMAWITGSALATIGAVVLGLSAYSITVDEGVIETAAIAQQTAN